MNYLSPSRLASVQTLYEKTSAEFDIHLDAAEEVASAVILQAAAPEHGATAPGAAFGAAQAGSFEAFTSSAVSNMATDVLRDATLARDLHRLRVAQRLSKAATAGYTASQAHPSADASDVTDVQAREPASDASTTAP